MSEVVAPPAPEPVAAVDPPAPAPEPVAAVESVDALPAFAQKMIHDLRTEAATNRTKATGAEQAKQETMDAIAKALGLKGDDDPAAAAKTAAEERDAAKKQAQDATTTLAVYRMAAKNGANADALTDSRSFMRALDAIDPAADDFATQVETAIKTAVEVNPSLKAVGAPVVAPARSGGPVGGGAPVAGQVTEAELATMSAAQIEQAQEDGRLVTILGRKTED